MNVYINQVDDGLGDAEMWDDILAGGPQGGPADTNTTPVEQPK
jgi:hypothetical protein